MDYLQLSATDINNIRVGHAGLFISRGVGQHAKRVIDSFELIFIRKGILRFQENGNEFCIQANQTLLLWPGREHSGIETFPKDLEFYWVHFWLKHRQHKTFEEIISVPQTCQPVRPELLTELFHRFLTDQETRKLTSLQSKMLLMLMLIEASRESLNDNVEMGSDLLASRARAYIIAHSHEPITTLLVSQALKCNPDYLGQIYKAKYGMTITHALQEQRMIGASRMLLGGDLNIKQIAFQCGFDNVGYFRRVFKRFYGVTPADYRKMNRIVKINRLGGQETIYNKEKTEKTE
ncbi:MAG: hypothetical protein A2Y10_05005 [Planctomycetes bacterium GWF2_41_51]|nr:MAG: hypothetical protein A2Y10_05005 [Planctomycetes bacterium GWF2_41_51]HBG25577.1 AraC family transcriptional regulator [Phycisphaerales bacterium]